MPLMDNDNMTPLVSIGIPTYNRSDKFLKTTLQSAIDQTYDNIEIIVADNCSIDNTRELVQGFRDSRVKYYRHEKNIGAANNFSFLLDQAIGDYFLLLHDDDLIDDDFIEICMKRANFSKEYGIIRTGTRVIDEKGDTKAECYNDVLGLTAVEYFKGWFNYKTAFYLCSTLFNTIDLRELGGFHSKLQLVPDGIVISQLVVKKKRLDIHEVKASFRKHSGEITFAVNVKDWCDDFKYLLDIMCNLIPEEREVLYIEGSRFFSKLCYNRAKSVQRIDKRLFAYFAVYKSFNYIYLPPPIRIFINRYPFISKSKNIFQKVLLKR